MSNATQSTSLLPNGSSSEDIFAMQIAALQVAGGSAQTGTTESESATASTQAAGGDASLTQTASSPDADAAIAAGGAYGQQAAEQPALTKTDAGAAGGTAQTTTVDQTTDAAVGGTRGTTAAKPHHIFAPSGVLRSDATGASSDVGNNPNYIVQGSTTHFTVSYDSTLGTTGVNAAKYILQHCESDYSVLQGEFGGITPGSLPFQIRLTTDSGGASHASCTATELFIGANSGGSTLDFMRQLVIAEEDEVFMGTFGHGWNCGASNGEGLSRVLANDLTPGAEPANFMSAATWLDSARPDWINNTENTDRNYTSIGCSVLFLNWMRFQLGYSWKQIIAAGASTLAQTYKNLTGKSDGYAQFTSLMQAHYPAGTPCGLKTDNPFPLSSVRYAGVFRPGTGAEWVVPAQAWPQMASTINTYFAQGLYVDSLDITVEGSNIFYSAVFRPGSGAEWVVPAQPWAQMATTINNYFAQGLRMTSIGMVLFNGQLLYTGVFRPGAGAEWVVPAQPWSQMATTINNYFKQGLYATAFTAEFVGGQVVYSGVFRPGSGAEWVVPAQPWPQMATTIDNYFKQSLDMTALDTVSVNGTTMYTGVFRPGSGAEWVIAGQFWDHMYGTVNNYFKQGLYMTAISTLP